SDHHGWLSNWLRRRLGCPQNAADLAQDTFLRLLTAREQPVILEPRAFLTTIARRVLANHFRRQEIERAYLEALAAQPEALVPSEES
ncbi:RNA polymerase subunit sigma, partial [Klebsiella pneumoniae]|nr:RNA polymerase subunit sigma [Klebsiella pneumoniae]